LSQAEGEQAKRHPRPVHLALGSNLPSSAGDPLHTLASAVDALIEPGDRGGEIRLRRLSRAYRTPSVPPGQPDYLNAAVEVATTLDLPGLLARIHAVERRLGRVRRVGERWGPRTIDIDILVDGESIVDTAGLTVPHPRLTERLFVLVPLAEIAPELCVPIVGSPERFAGGGRSTVASLLAKRLATAEGSAERAGITQSHAIPIRTGPNAWERADRNA
jgi:2-amino-4-hydroxy-6-hydroxymethyldihydropteridine diphosphokinase